MGCEDRWGRELECCNGCSTSIFMKDPAGAGERVFLRRGGELRRFGMGARDCALRMFDKTPLERWFVAEGIVEEDDHEVLYVQDEDGTERIKPGPKAILLVDATLCTWEGKLPAPPRP
jgi:hypothetical protein